MLDRIGTEDRTSNNVNASVQRSLAVQVIPEAEPNNVNASVQRSLAVQVIPEAEPTIGLCWIALELKTELQTMSTHLFNAHSQYK